MSLAFADGLAYLTHGRRPERMMRRSGVDGVALLGKGGSTCT